MCCIFFYLDILEAIAVIVASIFAIGSINSWKKESKWKARNELAEEVLFLTYSIKEKLSIIISPTGHTGEGKSRIKNGNESDEEEWFLNQANVIPERYEREKEPFLKLEALKHRVRARFSDEDSKLISNFISYINKTIIGEYKYLIYSYNKEKGFMDLHSYKSRLAELDCSLWINSEKIKKVNSLANEIEEYFSSKIK